MSANNENILPVCNDARVLAESIIASRNFERSKQKTPKNVPFMPSPIKNKPLELSGGKQAILESPINFGGVLQSPGPSPAPLRFKSFGRVSNNFNSSFAGNSKTDFGSSYGTFVNNRQRVSNNFSSSNFTKGSNFNRSFAHHYTPAHHYNPNFNSYGRLHTNFNTSAGVGLRDYYWIGEQRYKSFGQKKL
ncbi:unnamed protein product [Meloidogyne enterolobii]|uniref:Uncharacterized protein n=1 Tax=Meloidogyne enterolobii TaxID=390850 RepID=A0ACB1A5W9_MELEN